MKAGPSVLEDLAAIALVAPESLRPETRLAELSIDSLQAVEMVVLLEDHYGIAFDLGIDWREATVADLLSSRPRTG